MKQAERLLLSKLPARQRHQWERFRYLVIPSKTPGVVYKVPAAGFIRMLREGRPEVDLCVHPKEADLPAADRVLALKLLIEAEEPEFLKTAIRHQIHRPSAVLQPA